VAERTKRFFKVILPRLTSSKSDFMDNLLIKKVQSSEFII
jgi:hypothetical protein